MNGFQKEQPKVQLYYIYYRELYVIRFNCLLYEAEHQTFWCKHTFLPEASVEGQNQHCINLPLNTAACSI